MTRRFPGVVSQPLQKRRNPWFDQAIMINLVHQSIQATSQDYRNDIEKGQDTVWMEGLSVDDPQAICNANRGLVRSHAILKPRSDLPHGPGPLRFVPIERNVPVYTSRTFIQHELVLAQILSHRSP